MYWLCNPELLSCRSAYVVSQAKVSQASKALDDRLNAAFLWVQQCRHRLTVPFAHNASQLLLGFK